MKINSFTPCASDFTSNKQISDSQEKTKFEYSQPTKSANNLLKNYALAGLLLMGIPAQAQTPEDRANFNVIEEITPVVKNRTALSDKDLDNAPSPIINVAGKEVNAGIVVDIKNNKLYRYDEDGFIIDGYRIASGVKGKNGRSITHTGLRMVHHIETYPYSSAAANSKRRQDPKAFGPKILYLTSIDPRTGADIGSNGEFIHGNKNPNSIGKFASHGCMRMDNDIIKMFAQEVKPGTYVDIRY